jgi:4-amino-4-deoxy-L-arabinose transferase-like glycosyltransferase
VFAAGAILRLLVEVAYRPALFFTDSLFYLDMASKGAPVGIAPERPSGYPLLIDFVWSPGGSYWPLITLQHLAGLATGVLVYAILLRLGVGKRVAAVASAFVLLDGYAIALEQHVLAEAFFTLLLVGSFFLLVRRDAGWVSLGASGALLGVAITFRTAGMLVIPVWLVFVLVRHRVRVPAIAAVLALAAPLLLYSSWHAARTDRFGLTQSGGWFLYARVAEIGDCDGASIPDEARVLCDRTARDSREGSSYHLIDPASPAVRAFGGMNPDPDVQEESNRITGEWARAIIRDRPLRYTGLVLADFGRFFVPGVESRYGADRAIELPSSVTNELGREPESKGGSAAVVRGYSKVVHVPRPLVAVLLLLAAVASLWPRVLRRDAAEIRLFAATAWVMLLGAVAVSDFDLRYMIPAVPLALIGGVAGGAQLSERFSASRRSNHSPKVPTQ